MSFCEDLIPRNAPKPIIVEPQPIVAHIVPEVSLIFDKTTQYPKSPSDTGASCLPKKSYSEWEKENPQIIARLYSNNNNNTTGKQVRFEPPPILKFTDKVQNRGFDSALLKKVTTNNNYEYNFTNAQLDVNQQTATNVPTYNPLSLAHFDTGTNCVQQFPHTTTTTDTEIINHNIILTEQQIPQASQSELSKIYALIKLQSEQLLLLQTQVNRLLINDEKKCKSDHKTTMSNDNNILPSPQPNTLSNLMAKAGKMVDKEVQCDLQTDNNKINKATVQSTSTMTTFEHITEDKNVNSCDTISSNRNKPENTDLQYTNGKENICKTFYSNVLHDVNQFLDTPPNGIQMKQKCCDCQNSRRVHNNSYPSCNNDLQQDQSPNRMQILSRKSTDRSIAMNALALKYLSNDKLSELGVIGNKHIPQNHRQQFPQTVIDYGERQSVSNRRPLNEVSLGTFRYMEKYGLISSSEESVMIASSSTQNNVIHCNTMNDPNKKFIDSTYI